MSSETTFRRIVLIPGLLPLNPVKLINNVLTIQVPSQFFYEWLEEHYIDLAKRRTIKKELRQWMGDLNTVS
jgi:chromosomal replication initiation ATPase DnaA